MNLNQPRVEPQTEPAVPAPRIPLRASIGIAVVWSAIGAVTAVITAVLLLDRRALIAPTVIAVAVAAVTARVLGAGRGR